MYIYGEKILLRAVEERDNELLRSLMNDPDIEKMVFGNSAPVSQADQSRWFAGLKSSREVLRCIVESREDGRAVGTMILTDIDQKNGTAEIHIKLTKDGGQGRGFGTDCIKTTVAYAFRELRLNCIYAYVLAYNIPSRRLFEKCGFREDGILRSRAFKGGQYVDVHAYSLLAQEADNQ